MILVCGEALIDLFVQSEAESGPTLKAIVGGSPFNVAVGLARLGMRTAFLGGLSSDYFGITLVNALMHEDIEVFLPTRSTRPTPLALVSPDAHGHPTYAFYAHDTAVQDVDYAQLSAPLPSAVSAIALGSYALAVEPFGSALLELAEREASRLPIALDCNLRPALVGPLEQWRQRIERFARCASIIKLSDEDFIGGWGDRTTPDEQAARWLQNGAKLVLVTHGAFGATAWHRVGRVSLPALPIQVVDTVGAGDSFQAALLARLAQSNLLSLPSLAALDRSAIEDAMNFALLAASMTCAGRGADLPRRAHLEERLRTNKGSR